MNWYFDWNEGFMLGTSLIGFFILLKIRKYFDKIVFIIIWVYSTTFVATTDYFLAATPFKLYYCADNITYEPAATIIHVFLYPAFSFIFLYLYNRWNISGGKLILYLLCWDVLSVFFEWLNDINGVLTYTGWHLSYSTLIYPPASLLLIKVYHFTKAQLNKPIPN